MFTSTGEFERGLDALRRAVLLSLSPTPLLAVDGPGSGTVRAGRPGMLLSEAVDYRTPATDTGTGPAGDTPPDADLACSSVEDEAQASRLIALVELARGGDAEAFGQLYDHYQTSVYRFLYYRVGTVALAED